MSEALKAAGEGVTLLGEVLKVAGDNREVKEAGKNLAQAALTVTKAINNALLPLAAVNFAFEKARVYFAERFAIDLSEKASAIPPESVVEPKASIAGPALQGLAFAHDEPSLKDMYLNLLATAMDGRVAQEAHPAFVEIIRQLSAEEAVLIQEILQFSGGIPVAEIRRKKADAVGWSVLLKHLLNYKLRESQQPLEDPRLPAFLDNWVRLGLVEVDYTKFLTGETSYSWVEKRPEYLRLQQEAEHAGEGISHHPGLIRRSAFGTQFARAIGVLPGEGKSVEKVGV